VEGISSARAPVALTCPGKRGLKGLETGSFRRVCSRSLDEDARGLDRQGGSSRKSCDASHPIARKRTCGRADRPEAGDVPSSTEPLEAG
jgi:hypothetical protein